MNIFKRLIRLPERVYLQAAILAQRPDLASKPFALMLRQYMSETIEAHAKDERGTQLPNLVYRAADYEEEDGRAFWKVQALTWIAMYNHQLAGKDELIEEYRQGIEAAQRGQQEAMELLQQTIDMLNAVKSPVGRDN